MTKIKMSEPFTTKPVSADIRRMNPQLFGTPEPVAQPESTRGVGPVTTPQRGKQPNNYENHPHSTGIPDPQPERHKAAALDRTARRGQEGQGRATVRFVGYRVRPLDPDNFAGSCKALLDGLRYAQLLDGDEPWRIIFETEQVRVRSFKEEKTVIELDLN